MLTFWDPNQNTEKSINPLTLTHQKRALILKIAEKHGAYTVRIFGSTARGTTTSQSDLDILVDLAPGRSLLDLIAIKQDLEDALGCSVDVVTEASISPYIREQILDEAIPL